jgi:hypothetical protein
VACSLPSHKQVWKKTAKWEKRTKGKTEKEKENKKGTKMRGRKF